MCSLQHPGLLTALGYTFVPVATMRADGSMQVGRELALVVERADSNLLEWLQTFDAQVCFLCDCDDHHELDTPFPRPRGSSLACSQSRLGSA